jgi:hypothetical protein
MPLRTGSQCVHCCCAAELQLTKIYTRWKCQSIHIRTN